MTFPVTPEIAAVIIGLAVGTPVSQTVNVRPGTASGTRGNGILYDYGAR